MHNIRIKRESGKVKVKIKRESGKVKVGIKSKSGKVKLDIPNHSNMGLERKLKLISNSMNFYTKFSKWYTLRIFFPTVFLDWRFFRNIKKLIRKVSKNQKKVILHFRPLNILMSVHVIYRGMYKKSIDTGYELRRGAPFGGLAPAPVYIYMRQKVRLGGVIVENAPKTVIFYI